MTLASCVRRVRDGSFDPLAAYSVLCDEGRRADSALFETGAVKSRRAERSIVMSEAALRLEGKGRAARAIPLDAAGVVLVDRLVAALAPDPACAVSRDADGATFGWPPLDGDAEERARLKQPGPLDAVRALVAAVEVFDSTGASDDGPLLPCAFRYDFVESLETLPEGRGDAARPDFVFWVPAAGLEIHHVDGRVCAFARDVDPARAEARATALLQTAESASYGPPPAPANAVEADVDLDDEAFAERVRTVQEEIAKGNVYQAVPSRSFRTPCAEPLAAYARLRTSNPSPYLFFLNFGDAILFGASPETCLKVEPDGTASLHPLAGTRPRGRTADGAVDPERDARFEAELRLSTKETAEHMMLVDLARNDLARVCAPGSRRVTRLLEVERFSRVMHLGSTVEGTLDEAWDALHAYAASANMGTLVGAPKLEATALLRRIEHDRRGWYGGAVGFFKADGAFETAIVIRSAVVEDGVACVRAGAGVVEHSDPAAEADETRRKAQAVLEALGAREAAHA
ncbi:MAG: anthranilate synthase component 1 [Planctomycetota bacterium]|nr:anthranilate synthase component 1 [Planctomycetota bacterium]